MTRRMRIIPIILIANGRVVKTVNYKNPIYVGDPINTIKIFSDLEADEIIVIDILASKTNTHFDLKLLENLSRVCKVPLGVGGGISDSKFAREVVAIGAEKIVLNQLIRKNRTIVREIISILGAQAVVGSIDFHSQLDRCIDYLSFKPDLNLNDKIKFYESLGLGEILINFVNLEGTKLGLNKELTSLYEIKSKLPLILNGGISSSQDLEQCKNYKNFEALGVGSFFIYAENSRNVALHYER